MVEKININDSEPAAIGAVAGIVRASLRDNSENSGEKPIRISPAVLENKKLSNHIEEYFKNNSDKSDFIDLFEADDDNVDLRTDLSHQEIVLVNVIQLNSLLMEKLGIKNNIYSKFINNYKRLKVSLDRKSRAEFVDINKKERFENNLDKFNTFANLKKVKE